MRFGSMYPGAAFRVGYSGNARLFTASLKIEDEVANPNTPNPKPDETLYLQGNQEARLASAST